MSLVLLRSAPVFGRDVHLARWNDEDVLAWIGPAVEGAMASSRRRAAPWTGREAPGVWPLLAVEDVDGRPAWLYPPHPGVGSGALMVRPPPMRVCLELAAAVLEVVRARAAEGWEHPGPLLDDVLVAPDGAVHLAGFVGPFSADPSRQAPGEGPETSERAYRFGVLACELLGADVAPHGPDADAQRTLQRRVAIRIMSRPGPVIDEGVRNVLVRCLSFAPEERPTLAEVEAELRRAAEALLRQPTLAAWAPRGVAEIQALGEVAPSSTLELPTRDLLTQSGRDEGDPDFVDDDVTALSAGSTPGTYRRVELGSIPVTVGPPPEVARMRPSLPADLFDEDPTAVDNDEPAEITPTTVAEGGGRAGWVAGAVVMLIMAVALGAYVFG